MKKIDTVQKFTLHIDDFISNLNDIEEIKYIKDVKYLIDLLLSLLNNENENGNNNEIFQTIENANIMLVLLDNIHDILSSFSAKSTIINKDIKGIVHEFTKLKKIFTDDYDSIFKIAIQTLEDSVKDIKQFRDFSLHVRKYIFLWPLYEIITQILLKSDDIKEEILAINEENKSFVLSNTFSNITLAKPKGKSIGIKSYGLIPVSQLLSIDGISELAFKKSKLTKFKQFEKLCKDKKINLVLIKKQVNNGVDYNILNLLDYAKSNEYSKSNNSKDGITVETIKRYETIKYIGKQNKSNIIKYTINKSAGEELIILEEIWPNKYYIMSNKSDDIILKKSDLDEFINFVESPSINIRINDYNSIINKKIMKNMFLDKRYDIDEIKEKSTSEDLKYFKHEIQTNVVEAYTKLIKSINIKTIQDFSKIVLNKNLIDVFLSSIYTFSLSIDKNNTLEKTEIFLSYIFNISIYERDFKKRMNDSFKSNIFILKDIISSDTNQEILKRKLYNIFTEMLDSILNSIINSDNNIYQVFKFKNELLNIAKENTTAYQ
jgi:hypothetical protein